MHEDKKKQERPEIEGENRFPGDRPGRAKSGQWREGAARPIEGDRGDGGRRDPRGTREQAEVEELPNDVSYHIGQEPGQKSPGRNGGLLEWPHPESYNKKERRDDYADGKDVRGRVGRSPAHEGPQREVGQRCDDYHEPGQEESRPRLRPARNRRELAAPPEAHYDLDGHKRHDQQRKIAQKALHVKGRRDGKCHPEREGCPKKASPGLGHGPFGFRRQFIHHIPLLG